VTVTDNFLCKLCGWICTTIKCQWWHYILGRERPIRDLQPMSDVAMAISTDADTDADVARLAKWPVIVTS